MTDAPFETRPSPHVVNIGTAGGRTKPSTGYTFLRIQQQAMQIAQALKHTGQPGVSEDRPRFKLYDSILLNVLAKHRRGGERVFAELYARNPAWRIFKFLDEQTSLAEDLRVMASTHLPTFSRAALAHLGMRQRSSPPI
jgi:lycopene beta-cyclase